MKALILVDIQNDFCPGGSLPVANGHEVVEVANRLMDAEGLFDLVLASQDWHPADHASFASQHGKKVGEVLEINGIKQIMWPDHCVQNTRGAEFHSELNTHRIERVFRKGVNKQIDSYSCFFENDHKTPTGMGDYLHEKGVEEVHIMGLATDVCVKFSALDARGLGLSTTIVLDGCRGVELNSGDIEHAIKEMKAKGVIFCDSQEILC